MRRSLPFLESKPTQSIWGSRHHVCILPTRLNHQPFIPDTQQELFARQPNQIFWEPFQNTEVFRYTYRWTSPHLLPLFPHFAAEIQSNLFGELHQVQHGSTMLWEVVQHLCGQEQEERAKQIASVYTELQPPCLGLRSRKHSTQSLSPASLVNS